MDYVQAVKSYAESQDGKAFAVLDVYKRQGSTLTVVSGAWPGRLTLGMENIIANAGGILCLLYTALPSCDSA